jgi:hypothetical protein
VVERTAHEEDLTIWLEGNEALLKVAVSPVDELLGCISNDKCNRLCVWAFAKQEKVLVPTQDVHGASENGLGVWVLFFLL